MTARVFLGTIAGLLAAACAESADRPSGTERLAAPLFAATPAPDLDGVPDLTVDARRLAHSWLVRDEEVSQCAILEGGVSPGTHRLLRFTATTPNVGTADVFVGDPLEHVAANDGTFEFATCHDHFHFRNYATYELISVSTGAVVQAAKRGFCMVDVTPAGGSGAAPGRRLYESCGTRSSPGNQGISVGWADSYNRLLDGQYFVLDEPGAAVPAGDYVVRITVNPPFVCGDGDGSRPRDAAGFCRMFAESDYANNVGEAAITIADDTRNASGPGLSDALSPDELAGIMTKTRQPHH
ncbi:MAG: lysyl oxidase family protein [Gemmatimonadales bacterium]